MFIYLILSIIIIVIFFNCYIRIKHPFWSIQPAFHIYDLQYWLFPNRIIHNYLPSINKYVKLLDVVTYNVKNIPSGIKEKMTGLIQSNYLKSKNINYFPSVNDIFDFMDTTLQPSFISIYSIPKTIYLKKGTTIDNDIKGVISAKPLYITCKDIEPFCVNYIDNMCVHSDIRRQGIGQILIQTHHYNIRHLNKNIGVCLFKREGDLTAIVPLTIFNTFGYNIIDFQKIKLERKSYKIIKISKQTIPLFLDFFKSNAAKFNCVIQPEKTLLINLILKKQLLIYALIKNGIIYGIYIYKQSYSSINNKKGIECIATIKNCEDELFIKGLYESTNMLYNKYKFEILWIENTSNSNSIINNITNMNIKQISSCPNAFFLYNYAKYSDKPNNCLFIY